MVIHAVVGLFDDGSSLAWAPAVADPFLPRLFSGLFLHNQQIGYIKCLGRSKSLEGEVNSTLSIGNAINSTASLEIRPDDGPRTNLTDDSGSFVDPIYSSFTYRYQLKDRTIDFRDLFSVFLDAMASSAASYRSLWSCYQCGQRLGRRRSESACDPYFLSAPLALRVEIVGFGLDPRRYQSTKVCRDGLSDIF